MSKSIKTLNTFTQSKLKKASYLLQQQTLAQHDVKLKRGHATELVAAAMDNYKSMAALVADHFELDADQPEQFQLDGAERRINKRLQDFPYNQLPSDFSQQAAALIQETITPKCSNCGDDIPTIAVNQEHDRSYQPQTWTCQRCAQDDSEYGHCWACGDDVLYKLSDLNAAHECEEHRGESEPVDQEEADDHDSFAEYWMNHDPD